MTLLKRATMLLPVVFGLGLRKPANPLHAASAFSVTSKPGAPVVAQPTYPSGAGGQREKSHADHFRDPLLKTRVPCQLVAGTA